MKHLGLVVLIVSALAVAMATPARADPIDLQVGRFSNNTNVNASSQFGVALDFDDSDDTVSFTFTNAATVQGSITKVFFAQALDDYLDIGGTVDLTDSGAGVYFMDDATNGLGNFNWSVTSTSGYGAAAVPPPITNGINASGEWLTVTFDLADGADYDDLLGHFGSATTLDGYGVAFHWQDIAGNDGDSDWYGVVPEPTSIALFGLGAVGLVALRRRRRG